MQRKEEEENHKNKIAGAGTFLSPYLLLFMPMKRIRIPHFSFQGGTYFITFRLNKGRLSRSERQIVFKMTREGDGEYYHLFALTIMPDHVHAILQPRESYELARVLKGIKGGSVRRINENRGRKGCLWQRNYFDRILRDKDDLIETINYMLMNPVKARLVEDPWKYEFWYWKGW